ncbi:KH domain-containing protein [Candidatus Saccharibacteria bacterium]|nr:KH domain-containing protein [Candidatus Saccharibacteria bacterium]
MNRDESIRYAKKYLEDILSFFGLNTDVTAGSDDEVIELSVPSTHLNGFLIGQRGDTLRSLQFLVSTTLRNKQAELHRVNIDIAGYKKQRAERLAKRAEEWVQQVLETGEAYSVQPMNAADRRVVHQVITEHPQLETSSEGEGRDRHVVIRKKTTED